MMGSSVLRLVEERSISSDEAVRLLNPLPAAEQPIWALALYAGLRENELQAVRCCDIDISGRLIQVEFVWSGGPVAPESEMRRRRVPIQSLLLPYLIEHFERTGRTGGDLFLGRADQVPFCISEIEERAHDCWGSAGLEGRTLNECRDAFARILIEAKAVDSNGPRNT